MNRIMDLGQNPWISESELVTVQSSREIEAAQTIQIK